MRLKSKPAERLLEKVYSRKPSLFSGAEHKRNSLCAAGRWNLALLLFCAMPLGAQTRAVTDEVGRRVQIPVQVKRVVSLAPNLTEIVFALGKREILVGDTDFCDYPPEAAQKAHVGGPINPNIEQVVALRPDLVLASKSINRRETVDALNRLGLPVYVTDPHSVDEMILSVEHLGNVLDAEKPGTTLVESLRARTAELDRRLMGIAPRSVLFIVWTDPLISVGRDTFIADGLRRAGALSVVNTEAEWPRISFELVVRLQPKFLIFASAHAADTLHEIAALRARPGWRDLDAIRRNDVVIVSDAINRPAPRMLDAVEQLAHVLHPESFTTRNDFSLPIGAADEAVSIKEACACAR